MTLAGARFVSPTAFVMASSVAAVSWAHHSFAVHFVADRSITIQGTVEEFTFRNPRGVLLR